jgi:hypothetical protein
MAISVFKHKCAPFYWWQNSALKTLTFILHDLAVGGVSLSLLHISYHEGTACRMELRWKHWYQSKNDVAIQAIQNRLHCCGYNSMADRAWPFPSRNSDARACERISGYLTHCGPLWQEKLHTVAVVCIAASLLNVLLLVSTNLPHLPRNSHATTALTANELSTLLINGDLRLSSRADPVIEHGERRSLLGSAEAEVHSTWEVDQQRQRNQGGRVTVSQTTF